METAFGWEVLMSHEEAIRMFLEEQPHWLDHDVAYRQFPGSDEPEMGLSRTAMKAFIAWALAKGFVGKPERVPAWLEFLNRLPQMHAAHEAGICHPETCPIYRCQ
jgi:hypothetical protein